MVDLNLTFHPITTINKPFSFDGFFERKIYLLHKQWRNFLSTMFLYIHQNNLQTRPLFDEEIRSQTVVELNSKTSPFSIRIQSNLYLHWLIPQENRDYFDRYWSDNDAVWQEQVEHLLHSHTRSMRKRCNWDRHERDLVLFFELRKNNHRLICSRQFSNVFP